MNYRWLLLGVQVFHLIIERGSFCRNQWDLHLIFSICLLIVVPWIEQITSWSLSLLFFNWIVLSDTSFGSPYASPLPTTFSLISLTVVSEDLYLSVISTDPLQCWIEQLQLKFLSSVLVLQLPPVTFWSLEWLSLASSHASD